MNQTSKQTIISIVSVVLGFAVVFVLSGFLEARRPALPAGYEDEDLALQGAKLKGFALGFEGLIADWYWMKSLQYIGDKVVNSKREISMDNMRELNPRLLYPYLDNATTLDPKFFSVYEYGAIVLPAIDNEQAIKLTQKGIENNPSDWRLYNYLGYIYWRSGDYEKAAEIYERGSPLSGAPPFMLLMTAKMKSGGGSRETAREIYKQMFAQTTDENMKENAALRLLELDALDERDLLRQTLKDFQTKNNRCAADWREVFGDLRKISSSKPLRFDRNSLAPLDPTNVPYILVKESNQCDADIDWINSKIPPSPK